MTDKVLDVISAICNHPALLHDITKSSNEYYFRYKGHTMSLLQRSTSQEQCGGYTLFVYPAPPKDLKAFAAYLEQGDTEDIKMAAFHSKEIGDEAFGKLFQIVGSKYLNIDDIFNDILSDEF